MVVLEDDKSIIYCLQEEFRLNTVFAVLTSTNLELQRKKKLETSCVGTHLKDTDDMQADVHMQVEVFRNKSEALLNSYVCSKLAV